MALLSSDGSAAPATENDRYTLVTEHCDLEGYERGIRHQRRQLARLYGALVERDETLTRRDFRPYFSGIDSPDTRKRGRYGSLPQFYSVASEQLPNLPGVTEAENGFRFVGVDADAVDVETRPLSELRADPETDARTHLAEVHGPGADETETLLAAFRVVREQGKVTTDDLEDDRRFRNLDVDELADVPHIERGSEDTTAEDIQLSSLDTLADLEDAQRRAAEPPTETWSFVGEQ